MIRDRVEVLPSNRKASFDLRKLDHRHRTSAYLLSRSCFSTVTVLIQSIVLQRVRKLASEVKRAPTARRDTDSGSSLFSNALSEGWTAQATKAHGDIKEHNCGHRDQ